MQQAMRRCKVCGQEYPYCKTAVKGCFRWQEVACSELHAAEYFAQIENSRTKKQVTVKDTEIIDERIDDIVEYIEDEDDELFEECFDDDEEEITINT